MSLDYSPELLRQHAHYKEIRDRLNPKPKPIAKPVDAAVPVAVVVENPVETVANDTSQFRERDWLMVAPPYGVREIVKEVCRQYGVRKMDIESHRRTWDIVIPRQVAMTLSKHLTRKSLPEIGRLMGGRDHTTVLNACRKLKPAMDQVAARLAPDTPIQVWVKAMKAEVLITPFAVSRKYTPRKTIEQAQ